MSGANISIVTVPPPILSQICGWAAFSCPFPQIPFKSDVTSREHSLLLPMAASLATQDASHMLFRYSISSFGFPFHMSLGLVWSGTHLPIVPGTWADPALAPLVDEAIIVHNILLSLGLTVQVDCIPWESK